MLVVAPVTSSPGPTSSGTGSPVSMERSTAEAPSTTMPSVAILSPGLTTNTSPTSMPRSGTEQVRERSERLARAAARPRLEEAAEEDEGRDHARDLEIGVRVLDGEQRGDRPRPGRERTERDQRVHGHRAVPDVPERRAMERPSGPEDDRRGQREGEPLPTVELQGREHRDRGEWHGERDRREEPGSQ